MLETEKTKLCQFCEGTIPISVIHCPYCGSDLQTKKIEEKPWQEDLFAKEDFVKRFSPPYEDVKKRSPLDSKENKRDVPLEKGAEPKSQEEEKKSSSLAKRELLMIVLLTLGAELLALGLIILIFATEGELVLKWRLSRVFIPFSIAILCLFTGFFLYKKEFTNSPS